MENCDVPNFLSSLLSWSEQGDKTKGGGFHPRYGPFTEELDLLTPVGPF